MYRKFFLLFGLAIVLLSMTCFEPATENDVFKLDDLSFRMPKKFPKPHYRFEHNKLSKEVFELGRYLFYDPMLSRDNSVSCAACHQHFAAFAHIDHKLSHGIEGKFGTRNVPALQNLIWQESFMWDGGINHLEVQAIAPITSPIEMDESLANILLKLKASEKYRNLFQKAYHDTIINSERLLKALTQFTGLMISADSRYDRYLAKKDTFSLTEKQGLKLFEAKCASCHTAPLFTTNAYENNLLPVDTTLNDYGRYLITKNEADRGKFKVPSLRNIARTYPYMHDGRFRNMKELLNFYGSLYLQNPSDPRLKQIGNLSADEKKQLTAFLNTLTDYEFIYNRNFDDPNGFR